MDADVVVMGNGPAGVLATLACARAGLSVVALAPSWKKPWPARYALWADELPAVPGAVLERRWPATEVHALTRRRLPIGYALLDGVRTREAWLTDAARHGARWIEASVVGVEAGRVRTATSELRARAIVDASGAPAGTSFQCGWAMRARVDGHPFGDAATLMDWRGDGATFLYALPLGPDEVFVEETSLLGPAVDAARLEARLRGRLATLGIGVRSVEAVETCVIPMDVERPAPGPAVAFGASAGMVHPATGYLLPRIAQAAPRLAAALVLGVGRGPEEAARAADAAVWTRDDRARHVLLRLAARFLLDRSPARRVAWFERFFASPPEVWRPFLAGTASAVQVAAAMLELFAGADLSTRAGMLRAAVQDPP